MKILIALLTTSLTVFANDLKRESEIFKTKILKSYVYEEKNSRCIYYVVKYKNKNIIVHAFPDIGNNKQPIYKKGDEVEVVKNKTSSPTHQYENLHFSIITNNDPRIKKSDPQIEVTISDDPLSVVEPPPPPPPPPPPGYKK